MRKNHEKIFFHIIYNVLVFCQWTYKSVDNGFDDPYRIAYTATNNGGNLKLESMAKFTGSPCDIQFYITGRYYCDDYPTVNVSFLINGVYQKFVIRGKKSPDNTTIFFGYIYRVQLAPTIDNPQNTGYVDFLPLFKAASSVKIRVNETHCESDYYEFNMASSTAAYNFMSQGCDEWNAKQKEAEKIKFIDLFCGIGGFRIAMDEAYIENDLIPECFFSSDIDTYCQDSYEANFGYRPAGDITKIDEKDISDHDVLFAGFPCQPFSIIGQMQGFSDIRGTLFFDIARIIKHKNQKRLFWKMLSNSLDMMVEKH